eukprot:2564151-Pyramimonas_sp.AAC.1
MEHEGEEVDEAAREAVAEAKMTVLKDLQEGANGYTTRLQDQINRAKEQAEQSKMAIGQEAEKRQIENKTRTAR